MRHQTLHDAIMQLFQNKQFVNGFTQKHTEETKQKEFGDDAITTFSSYVDHIDNVVDLSACLVDLEHPSKYILGDITKNYIERDSRAQEIRDNLNELIQKANLSQ